MILHKIIDAMRGVGRNKLIVRPESGIEQADIDTFLRSAPHADKFAFVDVPFKRDETQAAVLIPRLEASEREMYGANLLPLPSDLCYFEYQIRDSRGVMQHLGNLIMVLRDDQQPDYDPNVFCFLVLRVAMIEDQVIMNDPMFEVRVLADFAGKENLHLKVFSENKALQRDYENCSAIAGLLMFLNLMLLSRTSEISSVGAPVKLNKARMKRGNAPLPAHRIVSIVPKKFQADHGSQDRDGTFKRLHWRRSHIRHHEHATLNSTHVSKCPCCQRTEVYVQTITRMLVGRRELGEVTHEYRIG